MKRLRAGIQIIIKVTITLASGKNYVRQKKKVARCHEKIRNQRKDYLHKLSRRITDRTI